MYMYVHMHVCIYDVIVLLCYYICYDVVVILCYTYVAMRMSMVLVIILLLLVCNTHCGVYNVIPDDIYYDLHCSNTTCQHCHTLQYYQLNATKYFTSNIQLLFFPGLHHLYSDLIIENVQIFHSLVQTLVTVVIGSLLTVTYWLVLF